MYKRNASQLSSDLIEAFPDAKVLINDTKPRSKSFELTVIKEDGKGWYNKLSFVCLNLLVSLKRFIFFDVFRNTGLDWNKERPSKKAEVSCEQ